MLMHCFLLLSVLATLGHTTTIYPDGSGPEPCAVTCAGRTGSVGCWDRWDKADDKAGLKYRGDVSVTKSGHVCQKWTSQFPNEHSRTPDSYPDAGLGDHNYCRNPDGSERPWCYSSEGTEPRWGYCDLPICARTESASCWDKADDKAGVKYRGDVSLTKSGHVCQRWTSQFPNEHSKTSDSYPDTGLGDHNYCRNPDGSEGPWCYSSEGTDPRWGYCDLPICAHTGSNTPWEQYDSGGITTVINTSECQFVSTPIITTSVGGDGNHWSLTGTAQVYSPSKNNFRIYVRYWNGDDLSTAYAQNAKWHVNWIAVGYNC